MKFVRTTKVEKGFHIPVRQSHGFLMLAVLGLFSANVYAGTVTYVYTDPKGTPLAEADAQGNITARFEYTPYGSPVASLGVSPNGPGYTGHVNDPDTGLVYMQARYYDPEIGRFLSVDPVTPSAGGGFGFGRYLYGNDNPISYLDPDGRTPMASPLLQLKFWTNYIRNISNNVMVAVGMAAKDQSSRVEIVASGTAVNGMGVAASKGLYNSGDSVGLPFAAGEGMEASVDVKYRVATFNFLEHPSNAPVSIVSHASAHALGGMGGEVVYNPGGTVKIYVYAGVGAGEAAYVSAVELDPNGLSGTASAEDQQRQEQWMQEQWVRQDMGIGREDRDYLGH